MIDQFDRVLRGKKFKKMLEASFCDLRSRYDMKQIEIEILLFLDMYPDSYASDICRDLDLNKGQVSQALNQLYLKGLLLQKQEAGDRRYIRYAFTEKGVRFIKEGKQRRDCINRQLTEGLSEEELRSLENMIEKIESNIEKIGSAK